MSVRNITENPLIREDAKLTKSVGLGFDTAIYPKYATSKLELLVFLYSELDKYSYHLILHIDTEIYELLQDFYTELSYEMFSVLLSFAKEDEEIKSWAKQQLNQVEYQHLIVAIGQLSANLE